MAILGAMLLGVTMKYPPYFGPEGCSKNDDTVGTLLQSVANRARVAIDVSMLWLYICSLVAAWLHTSSSNGGTSIAFSTPSSGVLGRWSTY